MKTEAIRLCIQAQYGKEDYAEARKELNALLARLEELEAAQQRVQSDGLTICQNCGSWLRAGECENCNSPFAPADKA